MGLSSARTVPLPAPGDDGTGTVVLSPEVQAALVAASRRIGFRYDVIAPNGAVKGYAEMSTAKISNNDLADVSKRTGEFVIESTSGLVDYMKDRLRAYALLLMPDDTWYQFPVGTFHMATGAATWSGKVGPTKVTAYDGLLVLNEDKVTSRYVLATGTNYRSNILTLLSSAGYTVRNIASSTLTLPAPLEWDPGTPKLEIVNDLLDAIGFRSLFFDAMGVPTAYDYQLPSEAPVVWTYLLDSKSVTLPGQDVTLDLFSIPNAWVAFVSEPDRPLIVSRYTNTDPNSILSTVSRGRTVVELLTSPDGLPKKKRKQTEKAHRAATQAVLDKYVQRAAAEASQQYQYLEFDTGLMPFHGAADVLVVDYGEGPLRWRETEWTMDLKAGGVMNHKCRRVVTL
jgi:hypothetical protein